MKMNFQSEFLSLGVAASAVFLLDTAAVKWSRNFKWRYPDPVI